MCWFEVYALELVVSSIMIASVYRSCPRSYILGFGLSKGNSCRCPNTEDKALDSFIENL